MKTSIIVGDLFRNQEFRFLQKTNADSNIKTITKLEKGLHEIIDNELTSKQCRVLKMYYFDNLTVEEIAQILHVNKGSVSKMKNRGLKKIETFLKYSVFR